MHAGDALDGLMRSASKDRPANQNYQGIADAELDRLIDESDRSMDLTLRNDLLARALGRVAELHAIVPLEIQTETLAFSREISWDPPINLSLRLLEEIRPAEE